MLTFYFIFSLFIFLILVTVISTIYEFVLKIVNEHEYDMQSLLLPSIISIISLYFYSKFYLFTLDKIFKIDVLNVLTDILIYTNYNFRYIYLFLLITIIYTALWTLIQTLILMSVNIKHVKKFNNTVDLSDGVIPENYDEVGMVKISQIKLTFSKSFTASLFLSTLSLFVIIILYYLGELIARNIIL